MRRAVELARRGEGLTRPNPPVGAVVVSKGRIVGEGFHRRAGGPHAEVLALRAAGPRTRGATLYVTLEPCCTWGRTPPCTELLLRKGVRRVVVGARDPNAAHAGKGLRQLRRQGVEVTEGVCREEALDLIRPFATWIGTGRPYVTLKLGMSADGKIADRRGHSRWITGAGSRRLVQELRRRADAVMVGARTVRQDDPSLLPRPARGRKPYRVVVCGKRKLPVSAKILRDDAAERTIIAVPAGAERRRTAPPGAGPRVLVVPSTRRGVKLDGLMHRLGRLGILHVLCEGGGRLAEALLKAGLVDELYLFVSPCIVGGDGAVPAVGGTGWVLGDARRLEFTSVERVGRDILIRARPPRKR